MKITKEVSGESLVFVVLTVATLASTFSSAFFKLVKSKNERGERCEECFRRDFGNCDRTQHFGRAQNVCNNNDESVIQNIFLRRRLPAR